jgi:glycerophosphoryl diester phosphodiesterase
VLRIKPDATVAYLNGDRTPQVLYDLGIKGIDYNITVLRSNPGWINDAHQLGMSVSVWTVSTEAEIKEAVDAGVDYITSDKPIDAKRLSESF